MSAEISEEIASRAALWAYADQAREYMAREITLQKPRLFLWFPVFLSFGIAFYFCLPSEPPLALGLAVVAVAAAALIVAPMQRRMLCLSIFLAALGFAASQARTWMVYTPILEREIRAANVSGTIEMIEGLEDGKGSRLVLSDVQIEDFEPRDTPVKVRVSVRKDEGLMVGQRVRVLAGLGPPSPPLAPGSFDFQRYMYFQRIGALGYAYKPPIVIGQPDARRDSIERLRIVIDQKIGAVLPYPQAAVASALVTGRRAAISDEANDAITAAGLAHILSISGLHIGLVTSLIFFTTRLLMACVPGLALRFPIKKYAAVFAFLGAVFYTLLAGATIPTQRSLIMVGVALLAIILDRSPISIRLVAFAALAVLVFAPESLISASFQMSFAAVAALIMVFDYLRPWLTEWHRNSGMVKKAAMYVLSICLTTVIATIATAPLTIFHFQQLAVYGVLGNALAVPLSAFVIMPAALISLLLMPFGLEHWPMVVMGSGITGMLDISVWVASLPHALVKIPAPPIYALPCFMLGAVFIFLIKGNLKYVMLVPIFISLVMMASHRQPDVLISPGFELAAVKGDDLYVTSLRREKFVREKWESSYGLTEGAAKSWPKEGQAGPLFCDEMACRLELHGRHVSFVKQAGAAQEECAWADVVFAFDPLRGACKAIVIDKFDVLDGGAHAAWLGSTIRIENAERDRGMRPWSSGNQSFSGKSASGLRAGPGF